MSVEAIREITGPFLIPDSVQCLFRKIENSWLEQEIIWAQSPVVSEACPQTICLLVKFKPMKGKKKCFIRRQRKIDWTYETWRILAFSLLMQTLEEGDFLYNAIYLYNAVIIVNSQ